MPQLHQVLDGKGCAAKVVIDHNVDVGQAQVAADQRDRNRSRDHRDRTSPEPRPGENDAVRTQLEELLQRELLRGRVAIACGDQGPVSLLSRGGIEAVQDLREEDVVEI